MKKYKKKVQSLRIGNKEESTAKYVGMDMPSYISYI